MELGVYIRSGITFEGMFDLALHAESLGYYGVFLNDHVHGFAEGGKEPYLEAWTALTGLGVKTSKIRLGHIVLFNSLRNPAFLAKSITALDIMTNGRYEVMFGAGWNVPEYEGYDLMEKGRGMPSARERVERFEEAMIILRGMFDNEDFSFAGRHWKLKNAFNIPPPIQNPMRISVGCDKPRMLDLTAKLADGLNTGGGLDELEKKLKIFETKAEKYGKKKQNYFISGFAGFGIVKNQDEYEQISKNLAEKAKKSVDEVKKNLFVGTSEILVEKLRKATDMGVNLMIMIPRETKNITEFKEKLSIIKDQVMTQL
jgi:alkanesulfonate monooxygenase SsuD/methylene tetrahydromethanopterin reductase-like flavin-dependent oxidoreductase (luciferase family)